MKNADVESALQKKSPGQRPGHSFLQEEFYQTHNPLVKGQISTDARLPWTSINHISSEVSPLRRRTPFPFSLVLVMYIIVIKFSLAFVITQQYVSTPNKAGLTCDCLCGHTAGLAKEEKGHGHEIQGALALHQSSVWLRCSGGIQR